MIPSWSVPGVSSWTGKIWFGGYFDARPDHWDPVETALATTTFATVIGLSTWHFAHATRSYLRMQRPWAVAASVAGMATFGVALFQVCVFLTDIFMRG